MRLIIVQSCEMGNLNLTLLLEIEILSAYFASPQSIARPHLGFLKITEYGKAKIQMFTYWTIIKHTSVKYFHFIVI